MSSKNFNNKKCASKLVFFKENEMERDLDDFCQYKNLMLYYIEY